jgi:hypothetical protein
MPEASLTLNNLLALPPNGFPKETLTAGLSGEDVTSLKRQVSGILKGVPWAHLEQTICDKLSETLNMNAMEMIGSAWEKYQVLRESAEQSKSGETVFVPLEEHSVNLELHPYVEVRFGQQLLKKIEFDVNITIKLDGLVLKLENEKIVAVEAGTCQGSGEVQIKDITLWQHDFDPIELGKVSLGDGIEIH